MIKIKYNGRLGNNLFQYSFGRILAFEKNYFLSANDIPGFVNTGDCYYSNKKLPIKHTLSNHKIDFDSILNLNDGILLNGHFERFEYFQNYKDKIKNWLYTPRPSKKILEKYKITNKSCIIHLRMDDVWKKQIGINSKQAEKMLTNISNFDKLYICSDQIKNKNCQYFKKKYNAIMIKENVIETYKLIKEFKKIVLSPSTFSWWAAWLSDANEIVIPWGKSGIRWSDEWNNRKGGPDLRVFDENRYKIINL